MTEFLSLAEGIEAPAQVGALVSMHVGKEQTVSASPARLAWLIRNCQPKTAALRSEFETRVTSNPKREQALAKLDAGFGKGIHRDLILEGPTHADCLIETESAVVWIEGKRNDVLSRAIKWDKSRDQLARNLEATWRLGTEAGKDWWLVVCYEDRLKRHEEHLIEGYRSGRLAAGLPHLAQDVREQFRKKIGTLRWSQIFENWPGARPD